MDAQHDLLDCMLLCSAVLVQCTVRPWVPNETIWDGFIHREEESNECWRSHNLFGRPVHAMMI